MHVHGLFIYVLLLYIFNMYYIMEQNRAYKLKSLLRLDLRTCRLCTQQPCHVLVLPYGTLQITELRVIPHIP